jgi:murein tripeptide amidase MpaA
MMPNGSRLGWDKLGAMPEVAFNRYYSYAEITDQLKAYAKEYPDLFGFESIGKSHEGRDIWLATLTNRKTGEHAEKPAFWCDGNIHASELSASTAVLNLIHKLCTRYGKDGQITRALDTRAFYLVPRLNPDGAEWALETPPRIIRSSTRPYPYDEDDYYGMERKDLDGDGRILSIRLKDPNGPWKISQKEPRLMERRQPGESGGDYYRLLPEGLLHNWDGMTLQARKIKEGLDLNRNFPMGWRPESEQKGAGSFPAGEPEIHASVAAIAARPNICGAVCFHTFSGVHIRPSALKSDDDLPAEDVWAFKKIGEVAQEMTGYPGISNYHEFKYHPKEVITGTFDEWMYEHRGVYAWTTEIWSPQRQAGVTDYKYIDWFREHPFEDDVKLLKWSDDKLGGKGHVDWYAFEHPQLGQVELGGWDGIYAFRNPPPDFLEAEVSPLGDWVIWQALATPKLELREVRVDPPASQSALARVRFAVQNTGWLPTNVTKLAQDKKLCRGVVAEIARVGESPGGAGAGEPSWLLAGKLRQEAGQLVGWSHVQASGFGWHTDPTDDVALFEWVVAPGEYDLIAKHERAGVVRTRVKV